MRKQELTGQIQIRLVEYSSSKVADPSEVPRILSNFVLGISGSQAKFL